ncbi:Uncharacterised protein g10449 [Pycnogonum litorale]
MEVKNKDGGLAWLVVFSSHFVHALSYGVVWSSAVVNVILLDTFHQSQRDTSLVTALQCAIMYVMGPVSSVLLVKLGTRKTLLIGGILAGTGTVFCTFVEDLHHFYITYSLMAGIGFGITYIPAVTAVSECFEKKRTIAFGFAVSGAGIGTIVFPMIITILEEKFGWRGMFLIVGGITYNICVFAFLITPYRLHDVGVEPVERCEKVTEKLGILEMFKNWSYIGINLNNVFYCCGNTIIYIHISAYMKFEIGLSDRDSAMYVSIIGLCNLIGRIVMGAICHHESVTSRCVYNSASLAVVVIVLLISLVKNATSIAICCAIYGFCSANLGVNLPEMLIDISGKENLGQAYGMVMLSEAIGTVTGGPLSGFLLDRYGRYDVLFCLSSFLALLSIVVMLNPQNICKGRDVIRQRSTSSLRRLLKRQNSAVDV